MSPARTTRRPPPRQVLDSIDLVQSVHRCLLPGLRRGKVSFASEGQLIGLAVTVLRHKVRRRPGGPGPGPATFSAGPGPTRRPRPPRSTPPICPPS